RPRGIMSKQSMADRLKKLDSKAYDKMLTKVDPFLQPDVVVNFDDVPDSDLLSVAFKGQQLEIRRSIGIWRMDISTSYFAIGNNITDVILTYCGGGVPDSRLALLEWINLERIAGKGSKLARSLG